MLLSILLRVENNRVYLRKGVELRPGYLGKWFEVIIHHRKPQEILMLMRRRQLNQSLANEKLKFEKLKDLKGLSPKYLEADDEIE